MTTFSSEASPQTQRMNRLRVDILWLLMVATAVCYGALAILSKSFAYKIDSEDRPTLIMLSLFLLAFLGYWIALTIVVRLPASRKLLRGIFASACLFRVLLLPSIPMHEIDIYRYIWDGAVFAEGISPYRYPPQDVLNAASQQGGVEDEVLGRLVALSRSNDSLSDSLQKIHYGTYPSPYPLVSQVVFAVSACSTPEAFPLTKRMLLMKGLLVLFDLATLLVVMGLMQQIGRHQGWSLAYGWCPLLMKEFANGGHLDSIAIFLTTGAIWMLIKTLRGATRLPRYQVACTGSMLALAIGAKLYPVVLVPLFAVLWWRRGGRGAFVVGMLSVGVLSCALLYPLVGLKYETSEKIIPNELAQVAVPGQPTVQPLLAQPIKVQKVLDPSAGLRAFLKNWEMNDLIFMVVLENCRPQNDVASHKNPWFVVMPETWSLAISKNWVTWASWVLTRINDTQTQLTHQELYATQNLRAASFQLVRIVMGSLFTLLACWLAWQAAGQGDPRGWCRAAMLTLAWFWLTCPTQNPWYWCWILPLLPASRYRTWYVIGAMTMLYYLRFWFSAHFVETPVVINPLGWQIVLNKTYDGIYFFHFVVVWIEFAPCLVALGFEWWLNRRR